MFEESITPGPISARVLAPEGEPIEFIYNGRRFHIHAIFDDGARAIWRVEAAPEGALTTFEIELDEVTKTWLIRPTSRPL